jgi:hypothetical protein
MTTFHIVALVLEEGVSDISPGLHRSIPACRPVLSVSFASGCSLFSIPSMPSYPPPQN